MANYPHNSRRPESRAVRRALETGDMNALYLALSFRQRRFCEEYVVDFNGSAAAVRAGYSKRFPDRQAGQLMMNEGVRVYCDYLAKKTGETLTTVDKDYIVAQTLKISNREGARDSDKLRGLEFLAKLMGLLVDRSEITGKDGEAIKIEQQRAVEEEADGFTHMLEQLRDRVTDQNQSRKATEVASPRKKDVTLLD